MLRIEDLRVALGDRVILRDIDLEIHPGETLVLFGPNGSGKTSLLMAVMGHPEYRIVDGRILFNGRDITALPMDERARLGIGLAYQRPPAIHGLKTRQMVEICAAGKVDAEVLAENLHFTAFLDRDLNVGFSGGEIKRSELLQVSAQQPELVLIDEPESGVDLESIALVGRTIRSLLHQGDAAAYCKTRNERRRERVPMGLIITHTGFILDYVLADSALVLYDGVLACRGNPQKILHTITACGYEECVRCMS